MVREKSVKRAFLLVLLSFLISGYVPAEAVQASKPMAAGRQGILRVVLDGNQTEISQISCIPPAHTAELSDALLKVVNHANLNESGAALTLKRVEPYKNLSDTGSSSVSMGMITIGGHVVNASGGIPPQNSFISLTIYENGVILHQIKVPLDQTGIYRFDFVPWNPNFSYQVSTTFENLDYTSGLIDGNLLKAGIFLDVPIVVYNNSTDTRFLSAMRMRITFDFTRPGWVDVTESVLISNPTSLAIVPANNDTPILTFALPKEAINIEFPDGPLADTYRRTADGFGDWQPIMPGDGHQIMVTYSVPFTSVWHYTLKPPIPVESLMVAVRASGVETSSSGMLLMLVQSNPERSLNVYAVSDLEANEEYEINFATRDHLQKIWIGIGFFAASLLSAMIWIIFSKRQSIRTEGEKVAQNDESMDTILDAIIALDDRFKNGEISAEVHQRARQELVEKLERLKDQQKHP
jgi:hypothetical protein